MSLVYKLGTSAIEKKIPDENTFRYSRAYTTWQHWPPYRDTTIIIITFASHTDGRTWRGPRTQWSVVCCVWRKQRVASPNWIPPVSVLVLLAACCHIRMRGELFTHGSRAFSFSFLLVLWARGPTNPFAPGRFLWFPFGAFFLMSFTNRLCFERDRKIQIVSKVCIRVNLPI